MTPATLDDFRLHVEERHYRRAQDGEEPPVIGCPACVAAFPRYFEEMRAARREYDQRPYHDPVAHERGHPERRLIGITERAE